MAPEELERHARGIWERCVEYVTAQGIEKQTCGILIVYEVVEGKPATTGQVVTVKAADCLTTAQILAHCAQDEMIKARAPSLTGSRRG